MGTILQAILIEVIYASLINAFPPIQGLAKTVVLNEYFFLAQLVLDGDTVIIVAQGSVRIELTRDAIRAPSLQSVIISLSDFSLSRKMCALFLPHYGFLQSRVIRAPLDLHAVTLMPDSLLNGHQLLWGLRKFQCLVLLARSQFWEFEHLLLLLL